MSNNTAKSRAKRKKEKLLREIYGRNEKLGWSHRTYSRKGKHTYEEKNSS